MGSTEETVFLTGGTGVLGRRLVLRLARRGHVVQMLVRRNSRRQAREWLGSFRREDAASAGRILLMTGNLTEEGILDAGGRKRFLEDATSVIHCAAATMPGQDRDLAWRTNVEGTTRILDLAREHGGLRTVLYLSDLAVAGDHRGAFTEGDLLQNQRFSSVYGETKLLAERRVRAAMDGLPIRVVRPASLVGEQVGGAIERRTGVYPLLAFLVRLAALPGPLAVLPVAPFGACARVHVLPVDWVADRCVELWSAPGLDGGTFQLSDPDALSVREFLNLAAERLGLSPPLVNIPRRPSLALWRSPVGRGLRALLEGLGGLSEQQLQAVGSCAVPDLSRSEAFFRPQGIEVPHLPDYLDAILEYVGTHDV